MANLIEVTTPKRCAYRGSVEGFSNVYIYRLLTSAISEEVAQALADEVIENERALHGPSVQHVACNISTPLYLNSDVTAFYQFPYDSALPGSAPTMDPERAIFIQWPAGRNVKNRPVTLRKWYHPCDVNIEQVTFTSGMQAQQSQITSTLRGILATVAQNLAQIGPGPADFIELVSPTNRERTGPAVCYPWLEHHELGEQWR